MVHLYLNIKSTFNILPILLCWLRLTSWSNPNHLNNPNWSLRNTLLFTFYFFLFTPFIIICRWHFKSNLVRFLIAVRVVSICIFFFLSNNTNINSFDLFRLSLEFIIDFPCLSSVPSSLILLTFSCLSRFVFQILWLFSYNFPSTASLKIESTLFPWR